MTEKKKPVSYKDAGVNIDKGNAMVKSIKEIVARTYTDEVQGSIGGFSADREILVYPGQRSVKIHSSTDGVGTKLNIAFKTGIHNTVGIDLVAMCVNDLLVKGVPPLDFLDYLAVGKLELGVAKQIISGVAEGCVRARCRLAGGETAEMPGLYGPGEYDLAGFVFGAETNLSIPDTVVQNGDKLLGLASSGLHSNGYSLVRKIVFEREGLDVHDYIADLGRTLGEELLEPTTIYVDQIMGILAETRVNGITNITGGGFVDNIPRILSSEQKAVIRKRSWQTLPIFYYLRALGPVDDFEMMRTFNNGIGMILSVSENQYGPATRFLDSIGEKYFEIGEVIKRTDKEKQVEFI